MFKISDKLKEINFDNLSGGQKQRIALIRALLKNSKILILDEVTSALDNENEKEIRKIIFDYVEENKITTIVISHKLNSFKNFDYVYKIINGKIFEINEK